MRQALKLALEALEVATTPLAKDRQEVIRAITAIKEALVQPEQEPVAWMNPYGGVLLRLLTGLEKNTYTIPLYTTPPQPKEPEKEPVAQCTESDSWNCKYCRKTESCKALQDPRNFASPPQRTWVGLTDEEIKELDLSNYVQVVRIVEAKLKDKNL